MLKDLGSLTPDCLQRDAKLAEIVNDILHNSPVRVSPATLVKAKSPILLHCRKTNGTELIRLDDILSKRSLKEVQVDASAESPPGDTFGSEEHFLCMSISKEDTACIRNIFGILVCRVGNVA